MSEQGPRDALPDALPPGPEQELLPCGHRVDDLLEQVAAGRGDDLDAHQATCPHCRATLTAASRLWSRVRAVAAREEVPPPGLLGAVVAAVRELARDHWYVVLPGVRGSTRIAARVLADVAQRAASRVPGVRVVLGRHTRPVDAERARVATRRQDGPGSAVGVAGGHASIDLAVVVDYGASIPDVAARVRAAVAADLREVASVSSTEVNVHVDDVLPPAP
ncbi:Asp23/Gls24 family envelope stress response protein [Kineococcus gypseus]|uniref:Asp23/Gls24 family envelope stress response protein n=1 Tax=Kineococcus gypseus TaxID=1637102 RepID=UPI003D7D48EA